jgi:UDP-glucose 4-epimerase
MRVAVTGGCGFIGANLCSSLLSSPFVDEVVVVDDLSTGAKDNLVPLDRLRIIEGSVLEPVALDEALSGVQAVVHLAARPSVPRSLTDPIATHEANATGTIRVLEAARRKDVPQLIVASSSSVYGSNPSLPKREDLVPSPMSPYAASKLASEAYALAYARSFGLDVLVFRFFNVFGPLQPAHHDYAAVIPAFISAALQSRPLTVYGDGNQTRDFTFVESVTGVIADAVVRRVAADGPVNLAFGSRISLLELISALEGVLGRTLEVVHEDSRPGDVYASQADQTLLRSLFPSVGPVQLEAGLRRTVDWFTQPTRR